LAETIAGCTPFWKSLPASVHPPVNATAARAAPVTNMRELDFDT
jgi:hypothetical protein